MSNAEKQARFRKKEDLKKVVDWALRDCKLVVASSYSRYTTNDIEPRLCKAAELPTGWTDADFELAVKRIENVRWDILSAGDPIGSDVFNGRNVEEEFKQGHNLKKLRLETEKARRDTADLANHLVSALEISQLRNEDRAAALMEAMRHVGRALASSNSSGQSDAMAVCLATVNPHYERPDWFVARFADWLGFRLDENLIKALGKRLIHSNDSFRS